MLRFILISLEAFLALTAFYGGWLLISQPDGSLLQFSLDMVKNTPFKNFFIPGLVLMLIVGGSGVVAAILLVIRHSQARNVVLLSAIMLGGWIIVQLFLVGFISPPLQLGYLALAVVLLLLGSSWKR